MLASGPLHLLFPLLGYFSTFIAMAPSLAFSKSLLKYHLLREVFLIVLYRDYHLIILFLLTLIYFFHSMYHYLALYDTFIGLFVNCLSSPLECAKRARTLFCYSMVRDYLAYISSVNIYCFPALANPWKAGALSGLFTYPTPPPGAWPLAGSTTDVHKHMIADQAMNTL